MVKAEDEVAGNSANSVGEKLAAARNAQGLSLDDVVLRTRVPRRHLEMIEAGNHSALPAIPYSAGFVKTYGQTLGLDGAELARQFRQEVSRIEQVRYVPDPFQPADPARMPSRILAFVALGVAVLLALGYWLWRGGSTPNDAASIAAGTTVEKAAPATTAARPASTASVPVPPAVSSQPMAVPPASGVVAVTAREPVWVKIYDKGGPTLFQGEMAAGQRFDVPSNAIDPMIWTGRPQALQVSVGTTVIPPLGSAEQTIRDVSLKGDALVARRTPAGAPGAPTPDARP